MENVKIKVLLVEDGVIAQKMGAMVLTCLNCEVDVVSTGEEALELFKNKSYELIFMDIGLPGMDGFSVTEKIRKLEKGNIPIIALTAHTDDDYKIRANEVGMSDFLIKPLDKENAQTIITQALLGKYSISR